MRVPLLCGDFETVETAAAAAETTSAAPTITAASSVPCGLDCGRPSLPGGHFCERCSGLVASVMATRQAFAASGLSRQQFFRPVGSGIVTAAASRPSAPVPLLVG
jgi:hypothetical protein